MLETEIDIVDFAPAVASENKARKMITLLADLQLEGISLKSPRVRVWIDKNGDMARTTHTTCMGMRSTATQEQWGKSLATSKILECK